MTNPQFSIPVITCLISLSVTQAVLAQDDRPASTDSAASTSESTQAEPSPSVTTEPKTNGPTANEPAHELAVWLDDRFATLWSNEKLTPAAIVTDDTFLRRVYLDLIGTIPSVAQTRDFLNDSAPNKRRYLVERLLADRRSAIHLARTWRRVLVPDGSANVAMSAQLEPWLAEQFAENTPYNDFVQSLITSNGGDGDAGVLAYYRAVGTQPDALATSVSRVFLGVRIGCAQCHDHPFAAWKQKDFWGMAAFFAGVDFNGNTVADGKVTNIKEPDSGVEYAPQFLWQEAKPDFPADKTPREVLAEGLTSAENPYFAATAVNRVWQHLCGRGLVSPVDDLDLAQEIERDYVLNDLAVRFTDAKFDLQWLIQGICESNVYQRESESQDAANDARLSAKRPLKTLTPDQVFDSLEQALALPISRTSSSPRYNGGRTQMVTRLNEGAADSPDEYRAGIPQALMLMNGRLISAATDLDSSRTLRAVVEAPFLDPSAKIETLYLATFTRKPSATELQKLLEHINRQPHEEERRQAYSEIFWALLNSPEFVLSR